MKAAATTIAAGVTLGLMRRRSQAAQDAKYVVCVTGGSGFLGSWCVKLCLERGWTVRATTRAVCKADFLKALPGAAERLTIVPGCDLQVAGSFDAAIAGCDAVLHTASPFFFAGGSRANLVAPAVEGTENVLDACTRLGVARVALTSSTAAIYVNYGTVDNEHVYSDKDWSDEALMEANENFYCLSKTLAEKRAWDLSKAAGCPWKLASMNPCWILGPMLPSQPHLNTSSNGLVMFLDGTNSEVPPGCKLVVDVRDVAAAHVAAAGQDPAWSGWGRRYLLAGGSPTWESMVATMRSVVSVEQGAALPTVLTPPPGPGAAPGAAGAQPPFATLADVGPSEELLGITYYSAEEMVASNIKSCLGNSLASTAQYEHRVQ